MKSQISKTVQAEFADSTALTQSSEFEKYAHSIRESSIFKPGVVQLIKKLARFSRNQKLFILVTKAQKCSLSWGRL